MIDVLALDHRAASIGRPAGDAPITSSPRRRHMLADLVGRLGRGLAGPGSAGGATGAALLRRRSLLGYTAASIALGMGLLAWTSLLVPPMPAIDPGFAPGTVLSGPTGGLLLWLVYGLLGSLRVLRAPGGATMTFHLPFVGAAMILGGPTAGAWVAFLSSIERRELETQPWYGILANHCVLVTAAVLGGLTTHLVGGALGADGTGAASLGAAVAGTLVLTVVTTGMGVVTVLLRDDIAPRAFLEILLGRFGRVTAIEAALVVILAMAYVQVGWWSPLLVGGFVLLVWDNDPMPAPDSLTDLLTQEAFNRRLEAGLGRMRRGVTPGATLLRLDLDRFKAINDQYGPAVGDEVLKEVGTRLRVQARRPHDLAGRLGGDEMALFMPGLADAEIAVRRASEVAGAIAAPIATSVGPITVSVSVGVLVVASWGGVPSAGTLLRHADQAMDHAKRDGSIVHLYDPDEPSPFDAGGFDGRR